MEMENQGNLDTNAENYINDVREIQFLIYFL